MSKRPLSIILVEDYPDQMNTLKTLVNMIFSEPQLVMLTNGVAAREHLIEMHENGESADIMITDFNLSSQFINGGQIARLARDLKIVNEVIIRSASPEGIDPEIKEEFQTWPKDLTTAKLLTNLSETFNASIGNEVTEDRENRQLH